MCRARVCAHNKPVISDVLTLIAYPIYTVPGRICDWLKQRGRVGRVLDGRWRFHNDVDLNANVVFR